MIVIALALIGAGVGCITVLGWLAIDLLLNMHTITDRRSAGIMLASIVLAEIIGFAAIVYEELRS